MPWKLSDVDSHNKGLTPHQKQVWVATANSALSRCQSTGGSSCDATAIKIANAAVRRVKESYLSPDFILSKLPQDNPLHSEAAATVSESSLLEAISMLAQDDSFSAHHNCVSNAVRTWAQLHALTDASEYDMYGYRSYAYVVDLYPSIVIFSWRNQLWRAEYTIDTENKASLGDPVRVKLYYAPVNVSGSTTDGSSTESSREYTEIHDPVRLLGAPATTDLDDATESLKQLTQEEMLIESECVPLDVAEASKGSATTKVCVISPGWGSYGYYSESVIKRDGPTAFPKGTHMHWDHPTTKENQEKPEGSLDKLAGVLESTPQWDDNGFNGAGLYADVKVFEGKKGVLKEIAPHIGVSIKSPGMVKEGEAEGRKGKIIESLVSRKTNAVDFVTIPGRGGKVADLVESARNNLDRSTSDHNFEADGVLNRKDNTEMDKEQVQALIKEAVDAAISESKVESDKTIATLQATVERQNDALRLRDAREAATSEVAKYKNLGDRAKSRVVSIVTAGEVPLTESGALDVEKITAMVKESADAEAEYLKAEGVGKIINRSPVRDLGESDVEDDSKVDEKDTKALNEALMEAGKAFGWSEEEAKTFARVGN